MGKTDKQIKSYIMCKSRIEYGIGVMMVQAKLP